MKKGICACFLLCGLLLTGCDVNDMGSLTEISKPYAAEYRCRALWLGERDMLGEFEFIRLTLSQSGEFTLDYQSKGGLRGSQRGEYEHGGDFVRFTAMHGGKKISHTFPYEKGVLYMALPPGGKLLRAEFEI